MARYALKCYICAPRPDVHVCQLFFIDAADGFWPRLVGVLQIKHHMRMTYVISRLREVFFEVWALWNMYSHHCGRHHPWQWWQRGTALQKQLKTASPPPHKNRVETPPSFRCCLHLSVTSFHFSIYIFLLRMCLHKLISRRNRKSGLNSPQWGE